MLGTDNTKLIRLVASVINKMKSEPAGRVIGFIYVF